MHARSGTLYPRSDRFDHVLHLLHDTVKAQLPKGNRALTVC